MNNRFGYYGQVNGRLMCFATEDEYNEYKEEEKKSEKDSDNLKYSSDDDK